VKLLGGACQYTSHDEVSRAQTIEAISNHHHCQTSVDEVSKLKPTLLSCSRLYLTIGHQNGARGAISGEITDLYSPSNVVVLTAFPEPVASISPLSSLTARLASAKERRIADSTSGQTQLHANDRTGPKMTLGRLYSIARRRPHKSSSTGTMSIHESKQQDKKACE
jgi:hypothetical protein